MDDLISRLSELRCQYNCFDENERDAYHTLSEAIKALSDVPDTNVGDMISRQAAIDAIHKAWLNGAYYTEMMDALEELPSADVAEVVRCKDCKLSKPFTIFGRDGLMCERRKFAESFVVENDDYCSYGERK